MENDKVTVKQRSALARERRVRSRRAAAAAALSTRAQPFEHAIENGRNGLMPLLRALTELDSCCTDELSDVLDELDMWLDFYANLRRDATSDTTDAWASRQALLDLLDGYEEFRRSRSEPDANGHL
jgi:hypothetical protein